MKRYQLLVTAVLLTLIIAPARGLSQSKDETIRLWNEAYEIETKAKTKQEREKAAQLYEQVMGMFEKQGDREKVWGVATNLGKVNCDLGQYAAARDYYQKALDVARKVGSLDGQAQGLNGIGCVHWELGQFDKAIAYFQQALDAYKRAGNTEGEGFTLNHIGEAYREQGQYAKATEYYQKGLETSKRIANPAGEADALHNLGQVSRLQGQYHEAMDNYEKSLNMYRMLGDTRLEGVTLSDIGLVYADWGSRDKAIESYQQALAVFKGGGIIHEEARTTLEIGRIHQALGEHKDALREQEEALASFQRGLDLYRKMGVDTSRPMKLIADLYLDMKDPDKAAPFVAQSKDPAVSGRLHMAKGEYEEAQRQYARLLESAQASGNAEDLFTAHTGLGKAYESLEDYRKAEDHYTKGREMVEEIRSSLLPAERKSFFNVRINGFYRSEPAKGLTRVKMKLNESAQGIATSEATRARSFADRLVQDSGTHYARVPPEIRAQELSLVTQIATLRQSRSKITKEQNPQRYDEISRNVSKVENEQKLFVEMLRKNYPVYAAMKYSRPVPLRASALRPDEHVVMFDVSQEQVNVKLIKGKKMGPQFAADWSADELKTAVERFRNAFQPGKLGEFDPELGHRLYANLLAPVMTNVAPGTPITIMPDGILAALPFEALVVSGKETWQKSAQGDYSRSLKYLGDVYPISYHQSITALTLSRTRTKQSPHKEKAFVLADPVFGPNDDRLQPAEQEKQKQEWQALPANIMAAMCIDSLQFRRLKLTDKLAKAIGSLYPGKADVYLGLDATKSVVTKRNLKDYGSIVFATHGYYEEGAPCANEPILALAGAEKPASTEGILRMTEVTGLDLNADVVALTACQTALGKQVSGEGTMGMGWAFQYAGARSVLMTLWSVDEEASVKLVSAFFRHLKAGKSKLESLNLARAEIRQAGFDHAYYWAPFILLGETQ